MRIQSPFFIRMIPLFIKDCGQIPNQKELLAQGNGIAQ